MSFNLSVIFFLLSSKKSIQFFCESWSTATR